MDKITTDSAKSILRVMLANAISRTMIGTITALEEIGAPLTEVQQIEIVASAMMDYRAVADDAEMSLEAEVVMDRMREAVNTALPLDIFTRHEWATEDEARQHPNNEL
jgi:hypothetical protein